MALFKSTLVRPSYAEEDSSEESLVCIGSPDATTISSSSNPSSLSDGHSKLKAHSRQLIHDTANGHVEFVALQRELARFVSKTRSTRTNVLRLSLLPFLRRRLCEILPLDQELEFRTRVLESWWIQLLRDLQSNSVSGADKAAYYETISGLISRPEWAGETFSALLLDTLDVVMPKVSLPNLSGTLAAFAGKLIAYSYVHVAGVADCVLFSLRVRQQSIDRLVAVKAPGKFDGVIPQHLKHLVACTTAITTQPPPVFAEAYAPWIRNWYPDSGIFVSFLKHYYSLLADSLPAEQEEDTHLAAPGLVLLQASIVQYLDGFMGHRREQPLPSRSVQPNALGLSSTRASPRASPKASPRALPRASLDATPSPSASPTASPQGSPRLGPIDSPVGSPVGTLDPGALEVPSLDPPMDPVRTPPRNQQRFSSLPPIDRLDLDTESPKTPSLPATVVSPPPRRSSPPRAQAPRVDRLRIFCALREILHNDQASVPFYDTFCIQFDRIIQTVALGVNVYYMNSCVKLCDFLEEWLNCVTISHRRSLHQVTATLASAVDWEFWINVASRMLTSENCHTEIRAISLLFNIWPYLPMQSAGNYGPEGSPSPVGLKFTPRSTSLLWDATEWLLSPPMWNKYFCHWSPLVRSYFHRLICFRIAGVSCVPRKLMLYDSVEFSLKVSQMFKEQILDTYMHCIDLAEHCHDLPCTTPSQPLANRFLSIGMNAAANQQDSHRVYMFDIFDNSAYYSDKRSASQGSSSGTSFSFDSGSSCHSGESDPTSASTAESYLRRVSSLSSMPSIQESVLSSQTAPNRSPSDTRLASKVSSSGSSNRWSIFRKFLPTPLPSGDKYANLRGRPKKKQHRFADPNNIPTPWQLNEPCPEVQRPSYRFNLGPTNDVPVVHVEGEISVPFVPFQNQVKPIRAPMPSKGKPEGNLVYWNYGSRALAEWNGIVALFEQFVERQPGFNLGNKLVMPFMVAEIPWRPVG